MNFFQMRILSGGTLLAFAALFFAACSKPSGGSAAANEKRYPLTGEVRGIDAPNRTLRVRHDPVEGLMPAMTMEFSVPAGDVSILREGQRIRATLVESGGGDFYLEKIWPVDADADARVNAAAKTLTQDTVILGNKAYREIGEQTPQFTLYDQDGGVVSSARFRGKFVMMNFIFTRCPVATMCPAAVAKFQQVQRLASEAGVKDLELVSITFDPAFDTPGVLKEYATRRMIDTGNYTFLTGPEPAIRSLLAQFGVLATAKGDLVEHTLATVLIDKDGRVAHRVDGSKWEPGDFVARMKK